MQRVWIAQPLCLGLAAAGSPGSMSPARRQWPHEKSPGQQVPERRQQKKL